MVVTLLSVGCSLLSADSSPTLDYGVELIDGGVSVSVTVAGGPRPVAWIGFGASPLGGELSSRRIDRVTARTLAGAPLGVRPAGQDAYRVDVDTDEAWVLEYRATIGSPPADFYHRASSASEDHMILLGVDVWARFFDVRAGIEPAPVDRPLENVAAATVRFDADSLPQGWVVVGAAPEVTLNSFALTEHPARSAFAIGPYRFHDIDTNLGLRAAIHTGWNVARSQLVGYARQLARVQASEFGRPPGDPAMMIFTPLPTAVRPAQGVRSAGMVWDRSLLLFAGAGPSVPRNSQRVREMIGVFLGHELFHLYVPWGLPVTQSLSWLSEGWAEHVGRSSARTARILSAAGADRSLLDAYERYREMGGARAGSLRNASEDGGENLRPLLYVRGELVFRILSLEWSASGKPGSFDGVLWQRLLTEYDGETPLEPEAVSRILSAMVSPGTVRRLVDGAAVITLPELKLGRR
jgi:hypothetical protein